MDAARVAKLRREAEGARRDQIKKMTREERMELAFRLYKMAKERP